MLQVCIRVRPLLKHEKNAQWFVNKNNINSQNKSFTFDQVECETRTQTLYNKIAKQNVKKALNGYHTTIMCYGQTTSGKTFTTLGTHDNPGILPCALRDVFLDDNVKCSIQYVQIYNEVIDDLLDPKCTTLQIVNDQKWGTTLQLKQIPVNSFDQAIQLLNEGEERRIYRETQIHDKSSRSHTIFRIFIENGSRYSCLNIVDLAGSERVSSENDINHETGYINKSLLALTNVINQLTDQKQQHISYRDSKLTRLLQNSLGGNSITVLICCISPGNNTQTLSTLQFAQRAKIVKNTPIVNGEKQTQELQDQQFQSSCQQNFNIFTYVQSLQQSSKSSFQALLKLEQKYQNKYSELLQQYYKELSKFTINEQDLQDTISTLERNIAIQLEEMKQSISDTNNEDSQYKLLIWGSGQDGRLGFGDEKTCKIPQEISNYKFSQVSCGFHHTLAICNGFIYAWGRGQKGQLGLGNYETILTPKKIENLRNATQIACGWQHSLAICDGNLYSWGCGDDGQLGNGDCQSINQPIAIQEDVESIYAGHSQSGFMKEGMLYTFGNNQDGRCMIDSLGILTEPEQVPLNDIKSVSLGVSHMGVVTNDGCVYMAGTSIDGQLGTFSTDDEVATWFTQLDKFNSSNRASQIQCGDSFTLVLNTKGIIYAFGKGSFKRLGLPTTDNIYEPTPLPIQGDMIVAGCRHACTVTKNGQAYMWGFNFHNQLGLGQDDLDQEPVLLKINNIKQISLGYFHSAALVSK
ncbi:unnamed protein product (macronuclear) [Paramecium tetraurelia]|uniref:Kinesin motor domain-containing protein n=1 Tax=Paramecium tetraurelia TaxID=5888 RepID=A0BU61_PARTE|nr:uncharacterized protein GSPATT00032310001 [Paramecium tetraurelia]CAK62078.1 unnamed protein product [Paramecium tetraurelia]|eukprot:XP_001429476.1 hypothetical protein (macronuclear) [Paramecium tetraurelia strain d4-2]